MALGSSIGTSFVGPVVLGIYVGRFFDRRLKTDPWFSLAGVILGLALGVAAVVQIIRLIERTEQQ